MNVEDFITSVCLVEDYDKVSDGSFRLEIPFRYPDGSHIEVFQAVSEDFVQLRRGRAF